MRKRRYKRKRRPVPVPIASMGDIAFLLIIFFMLASEFVKRPVVFEPATSEHVEQPEDEAVIEVAIDEDGVLLLDGEPVPNADAIEIAVSARLADTVADEQRHVQLKVDRDLPYETYQPVIAAIAAGGGILQLVGEPPDLTE